MLQPLSPTSVEATNAERLPTSSNRSAVAHVEDVTIVVPSGTVDAAMLEEMQQSLHLPAGGALIVDLSECMIVDFAACETLDARQWNMDPEQFCVVCGRLSGRRLISRAAGLADRICVFATIGDALQARLMARSGYGRGWVVRPFGHGKPHHRPQGHAR